MDQLIERKVIERTWLGKRVIRRKPEGHEGPHTVMECFWDEKGALHCLDDAGYWTPSSMLKLESSDWEG